MQGQVPHPVFFARQLHLIRFLLSSPAEEYDIFFVDQLSTYVHTLPSDFGR